MNLKRVWIIDNNYKHDTTSVRGLQLQNNIKKEDFYAIAWNDNVQCELTSGDVAPFVQPILGGTRPTHVLSTLGKRHSP